ncbi:MAG: hypothetical protein KBS83_01290, partial [Lachnospiraceae bacterium]|nr:hypothetical protein [Candidatus Equihabitans merdae]
CSIPEIKEKLLSGSDETFYTFYRHQQEELIRQEAEIHQKINAMDRLIHLLPLIQAVDGQGVVVTPIARPIFFQVSPLLDPGDIRDGTAMRYHALAHSLSRYEQFPLGNILNAGSFLEGHNHISHVFTSCDAPKRGENAGNADRPRRSRKADTFCVANRILALVHKESQGPIDQAYDLIREYVRDNNLTLRSDLCVFSVVNAIDPAEQNRYMTFLFAAV